MATQNLSQIRAENARYYGAPAEAREYAADHGAVFCEDCHGVFEAAPENEGGGHECRAAASAAL